MFSDGTLHTDAQMKDNRLKLTYTISVWKKGCSMEDLPEAMDDREQWREGVKEIYDKYNMMVINICVSLRLLVRLYNLNIITTVYEGFTSLE